MTPTSFRILQAVAAAPTGTVTRSQLATDLGMPRTTIAHSIGKLELEGYLTSKASRSDDRIVLAEITASGRRQLNQRRE